jgi:hypothetical protein
MVARWVLCIPATSAESERAFSLSGRLVSPLRTRLKGSRVHDLTRIAGELRRRAAQHAAARSLARAGTPGHDVMRLDADNSGELTIDSDDEDDLRALLGDMTEESSSEAGSGCSNRLDL